MRKPKSEVVGLAAIAAGQTAGFMGAFQDGAFRQSRNLGYLVGLMISMTAAVGVSAVTKSMLPLVASIASAAFYISANEYARSPGGKVPGRLRFN